jgi:hypothetical protein
MGTNQVGRGRSVGVGQQELQLRLPKRSAGSNETRVVFQRGTPDLTQMQRQAMSTSPKIQAAQQGLASRVGAAMSPNTQAVATGEIKNPSLSALVPQKAKSQQDSNTKLATKATGSYQVTRDLLSDPTKQAYIASSREKLVKSGQAENLEFLLDLKKFRDHPSIEAAKELKRIYIDSNDDDFDVANVSGDQFGVLLETKSINITEQAKKLFLTEFESCIKCVERGDSVSKSGLQFVFNKIESEASFLLIQELKKLEKG